MTGPTPYLHGNHDPCPSCELRREAQDTAAMSRPEIPCNQCGGLGYLPLPVPEIVSRMCADARRWHWPAFDRACETPRTPLSVSAIREDQHPCREHGEDTGCGGEA